MLILFCLRLRIAAWYRKKAGAPAGPERIVHSCEPGSLDRETSAVADYQVLG